MAQQQSKKKKQARPRSSEGKFVKIGESHGVWVAEIPTDTAKKDGKEGDR